MSGVERSDLSRAVGEAILRKLASDPRTADPMNALILWTELGRGLAGTLERKGADLGLLGEVIVRWCAAHGSTERPPERWFYKVDPPQRLTRDEVGVALRGLHEEIAKASAELAHESAGGENGRELYLTIVNGWFPVGLALIGSLPPALAGASDAEQAAALAAWCARFLPRNSASPAELGVRMTRE